MKKTFCLIVYYKRVIGKRFYPVDVVNDTRDISDTLNVVLVDYYIIQGGVTTCMPPYGVRHDAGRLSKNGGHHAIPRQKLL